MADRAKLIIFMIHWYSHKRHKRTLYWIMSLLPIQTSQCLAQRYTAAFKDTQASELDDLKNRSAATQFI